MSLRLKGARAARISFSVMAHGLTQALPLSRPLHRSPRDRTLLIMTKSISLLSALLLLAGFAAHAAPPEPPALADLATKVMPAVVSIASTDPVNDLQGGAAGGGNGGST